MIHPFAVLPGLPLKPGSSFAPKPRPPELVYVNSPAFAVMTDFTTVTPVTIRPDVAIDVALNKMKVAGVRLLFVINDEYEIIGLVTANDIMGERPIKITQQTRRPRADITVASIMTPQSDIQVLDARRVESSKVGDIIKTLHSLERQHALVAQIDEAAGRHSVIGMFSTSRISNLLDSDVMRCPAPALSLAEIVEKIG